MSRKSGDSSSAAHAASSCGETTRAGAVAAAAVRDARYASTSDALTTLNAANGSSERPCSSMSARALFVTSCDAGEVCDPGREGTLLRPSPTGEIFGRSASSAGREAASDTTATGAPTGTSASGSTSRNR
jgi:hypothetical protein